jgi:hypothetical protein
MTDALLFAASSLFFVSWTLTITALAIAAFGRDLIPSRCSVPLPQHRHPAIPPNSRLRD